MLLRAVTYLQKDVAVAHLWTEEYISGDRVPLEQVYDGLDRSQAALHAMLG